MKKIITLLLMLCMITLVIAPSPTLGTFKKSDNLELRQTCTINGTFCDSCNISSVDYPNGSRLISDVGYTKRSGDFNYTINTTTENGQYKVNGFCQFGDDVIKNFVYYFDVTESGTIFTTSKAILYVVLLVIIIGMFILTLYGSIVIPWKNNSSQDGSIISINDTKYFKPAFMYISYLEALFISALLYGLTRNFLDLGFINGFVKIIYYVLLSGLAVSTPLLFLFIIIMLVQDKKLMKSIERGIVIRR